MALTRELQPGIVINDRLDIPGDLVTPEQYQPAGPMRRPAGTTEEPGHGELVAWEACQTINGSWGYHRDNTLYKSPEMLVRMLVDGVSKGGNLLLNVGPTGRGTFDPVSAETLAGLGDWMRAARTLDLRRRTERAHPAARLPLHPARGPALSAPVRLASSSTSTCPGWRARVAYAQLLDDASEISFSSSDPDAPAHNTEMGGQPAGTLTLSLPIRRPAVAVPVVELFLA